MRGIMGTDTARRAVLAALAGALLGACGSEAASGQEGADATVATDSAAADSAGDSDPGGSGAPDAADGAGPVDTSVPADVVLGDPEVLVGRFQVRLVPPDGDVSGFTSLVGKVYDGPTPSPVRYVERESDGDCRLLVPVIPFCEDACTGGAICVADDVCQAYPTAQDVGTVTVTGVENAAGDTTFSMTPISKTYQPLGGSLPYPAFAEGDEIRLASSGGAYVPFAATAKGVRELALTSGELTLDRGAALTVTWEAGGEPTAVIDVSLDISHHGGTKGVVTCSAADSGSLTVSAALVTGLLDLGYSGLPTIIVTRRTTGSGLIEAGRVDLDVSSQVEAGVSIPGLISCTDTSECPEDTTCQDDLRCQ